jgi:tetratricopeptide (TPR) repeat protein
MPAHFDRALLLFDQSRYDLAEQELRQALGEEPNDPAAHALLAMCLSRRKDHAGAIETAERAVGLAPDLAFAHYALANALHFADRESEAAVAIDQAINLDPLNSSFQGMQASIRFARRDWAGALESADAGLRLDPQDDVCTNLRAMALVQLGRRDEAGAAIQGALERDPENAVSHANQGWTLLHERKPKEALEHFREGLRLDPTLDWARAGMVEALKARHLVYRVMLGFFLWMNRFSAKAQWVLIIGILFGQRALVQLAKDFPAFAPFIDPILYAIFGFVLLTWTAVPLFNLLLRLNPTGRHALRREQIVASNWLGASLLVTLAVLITGLTYEPLFFLRYAAIPCLLVCAAVAGVFKVRWGWPRLLLAAGTLGLTFLLVRVNWNIWELLHTRQENVAQRLAIDIKSDRDLVLTGVFVYFIAANALMMTRAQRSSVT